MKVVDLRRGGKIRGPGTGTSDSIVGLSSAGPVKVSNGEFVIKAKSAAKLGMEKLQHINKHGKLPRMQLGGDAAERVRQGLEENQKLKEYLRKQGYLPTTLGPGVGAYEPRDLVKVQPIQHSRVPPGGSFPYVPSGERPLRLRDVMGFAVGGMISPSLGLKLKEHMANPLTFKYNDPDGSKRAGEKAEKEFRKDMKPFASGGWVRPDWVGSFFQPVQDEELRSLGNARTEAGRMAREELESREMSRRSPVVQPYNGGRSSPPPLDNSPTAAVQPATRPAPAASNASSASEDKSPLWRGMLGYSGGGAVMSNVIADKKKVLAPYSPPPNTMVIKPSPLATKGSVNWPGTIRSDRFDPPPFAKGGDTMKGMKQKVLGMKNRGKVLAAMAKNRAYQSGGPVMGGETNEANRRQYDEAGVPMRRTGMTPKPPAPAPAPPGKPAQGSGLLDMLRKATGFKKGGMVKKGLRC